MKKKTDLCFQIWYNKFSKFSLEHIRKSKTWELCSYYDLNFYRGVMCNENEEWCQIWRGIDLSVEIDMRSLTNFDLSTQKFQEFALLMSYYLPKYIMFELKKKQRRFLLWHLNIGVKFEGKLTCSFKNDMRNFANSHQSMLESLKIWTCIGLFYPM